MPVAHQLSALDGEVRHVAADVFNRAWVVELHRHLTPRVRARKHLRERGVIDVQLVPARLHPAGDQADFADDAVGAIHPRSGERSVKLAPGGVREFDKRGFCCGHAPPRGVKSRLSPPMSLHIKYDHVCPRCAAPYIPYDGDVPCPACGLLETERFTDFIAKAAKSAQYNFAYGGRYIPLFWHLGSFADQVLSQLFSVLDQYVEDPAKRPFPLVAREAVNSMEWGKQTHGAVHLYGIALRVFDELGNPSRPELPNIPPKDEMNRASSVIRNFLLTWRKEILGRGDEVLDLAQPTLDLYHKICCCTQKIEAGRANLAFDWFVAVYTPKWLELAGLSEEAKLLRGNPTFANCHRILDKIKELRNVPRLEGTPWFDETGGIRYLFGTTAGEAAKNTVEGILAEDEDDGTRDLIEEARLPKAVLQDAEKAELWQTVNTIAMSSIQFFVQRGLREEETTGVPPKAPYPVAEMQALVYELVHSMSELKQLPE